MTNENSVSSKSIFLKRWEIDFLKQKHSKFVAQQNSPIKKSEEFLQIDEIFLDQKLGSTLKKGSVAREGTKVKINIYIILHSSKAIK